MAEPKTFNLRVRHVRELRGMSARELDRRIGMTYGYSARAERRDQAIDVRVAAKIADALGCRLEYLIHGKRPMDLPHDHTGPCPDPALNRAIAAHDWPDWVVATLREMQAGIRGAPDERQWTRMADNLMREAEWANDVADQKGS